MATLTELLSEIRELLGTLSDKFDKLAWNIASMEPPAPESELDMPTYPPVEGPELIDSSDDTQSLEPPPEDLTGALEEETKVVETDEPKTSEMKAVRDGAADTETLKQEEESLMPPPSKTGALALLEKLSRLQEIVEKKGLEVSAKDFTFIPKSTEIYASLSDEDRVGSKGARIVLDCINFLDTIAYKLVGEYYSALREAVAAMTRSLSEFLQREVGYKVFPIEEETRVEIEENVPEYAASVQEKKAFSSEPAGTILAVRRRGAIFERDVVRKAWILTSSGEQSEVGDILEAALSVISTLKADSEHAAEMKLKAMGSLMEWREKLFGANKDHALTTARYALNMLHTLENPAGVTSGELFPGQTQKLKKVNDSIVALLRSAGLSEILLSVGGMFDESYDPSKYERKKVASDKPEGYIVGVLRRGFLDRNGIPIQKAVVAVSGK
jgi:hypothetical protein